MHWLRQYGYGSLGWHLPYRCSFLTECLDVTALIIDVGHVHVDETETNLLQFHLDVAGDGLEELVTVGVQFLNTHGGNHQTQLTEEDVSCQFLNMTCRETQQTLSCCCHALGVGGDTDRKAARYIHTDVLT